LGSGREIQMVAASKTRNLVLACIFAGGAKLVGCAIPEPDDEWVGRADEELSPSRCPGNMPKGLAPDADQRLHFVLHGVGSQIYACEVAGSAWVFRGPQADLLNAGG